MIIDFLQANSPIHCIKYIEEDLGLDNRSSIKDRAVILAFGFAADAVEEEDFPDDPIDLIRAKYIEIKSLEAQKIRKITKALEGQAVPDET